MAGALEIDEAGDVYISGNLNIAGQTTTKDLLVEKTATVSGSLFTDLIKSKEGDVAVNLSEKGFRQGKERRA